MDPMETTHTPETLPDPVEVADAIVLKHAGPISDEAGRQLQSMLQAKFPGRNCLVLGDGLDLVDMREQGEIRQRLVVIENLLAELVPMFGDLMKHQTQHAENILEFMERLVEEDPDPEEDAPQLALDGSPAGGERDQNAPL